ncbi:major facilitator superfamily transporter [Burkholderiales bacterium GJ-E10]|nr:major facilitator superfamily transporter [Burkholderiales bacterium GJ-E10]
MSHFRTFLRAGHAPTLAASFFYLTFTFAVWVLNGALAPFIGESFGLSPAQKGLMLSVPIMAGALMRFPLGVLAQYIGRKRATLAEMSLIAVAMLYGYLHVQSFGDLLAMGILLGVAGASFGVAMSLGSGWFPAQYKGLAMGLVGAGNVGTAVAVLIAPPLAQMFGWQTVYGIAAASVAVPAIVMIVFAKEPPDVNRHAGVRAQLACLFEKDGWAFSLIYIITFGGFIGLSSFLPTYYYDQFHVSKVQAGQLAMLAAFVGSALRIFGGWISDHWGGVNTLTLVLIVVAVCMVLTAMAGSSILGTTLLLMTGFAALGAGNGALFQLVPLRWPLTTAVASAMIGEVGALGGSLVPSSMGLAKQYSGSYGGGFMFFAMLSMGVFLIMRKMHPRWTRTWVAEGGRAHGTVPATAPAVPQQFGAAETTTV